MSNGDSHKTGVVQAMQDERTIDILDACYPRSHPLTLVLRHNEGHYNGVKYGSLFVDW